MPYRRLPNTDTARIRAMKKAFALGQELPPSKLAFSSKNLLQLQRILPGFEQGLQFQRHTLSSQTKKGKSYTETVRKAKIYLTHFLRVMNMAIYRGELPADTRAFYGLATNESTIPSFNTENELLTWGRRIIEGEEFRIKKGGSPITNPTIAVVKVRFEHFIDALNNNNNTVKKNLEYSRKLEEIRKEADDIILNVWNEVEASFSGLDDTEKRKKCEDYGLIYFFRKKELEKAAKPVSNNIPALIEPYLNLPGGFNPVELIPENI